ncbi:leucine-rich repeat protein [Skeletonema marinoi]|uniref:Leucine-rich repeat protein n=1 Tax=Skeletonema marinoi TaxID=267567 RepID=A0AAD9D519_9STRA|nr:leucine-rich repeat protein [Skeletonema marinoi]
MSAAEETSEREHQVSNCNSEEENRHSSSMCGGGGDDLSMPPHTSLCTMTTLRNMDEHYEERARDVNLEDITSSEYNAFVLEMLRDDELKGMGILGEDFDWPDENDFVVREGDNLGWLGYFIGNSERLESLWLSHLPGDDSFRQGLARNQSIQKLYIYSDLGEAGFQSLAPFFRNTSTLRDLVFTGSDISSLECAQNITLLLSRYQIKSLKSLEFEENNISDEGFAEIARALSVQPQLEELNLKYLNADSFTFGRHGYVALGTTMKSWRSPSLKKLVIRGSFGGGMANCFNLEHLNLGGNDQITVVGFRALSALVRSKKFCLQSLDVSYMSIDADEMTALADGLASMKSLKSLDLSFNDIGDEGLQALAASLTNSNDLEQLDVSCNGSFSAIGLKSLAHALPEASYLKELHLRSNSINDEGLKALAVGLTTHNTLERLDLSRNAISSDGLQALTAANTSSLRWLSLESNAIDDEAVKVLVEGMENLCNSCSLKEIDLDGMDIGDGEAEVLAEGSRGNTSLTKLFCDQTNVTALGWSAFSRLLCDTSSVNNTYLSNHTLEVIGCRYGSLYGIPSSIQRYLKLNKQSQYDVPICKILVSHSTLDMTPFFQWRLKLLPLVVAWFERARSCLGYVEESMASFETRELSSVYQFTSFGGRWIL